MKSLVHGLGRRTSSAAVAPIAVERVRAKSRLVTRWQISYLTPLAGSPTILVRKLSTRLYEYNKARRLVARLRARGNDAYVAGAVMVRL